jgi:endogenous inhibitor of DNA gyrase (YacG/DUF329 family)
MSDSRNCPICRRPLPEGEAAARLRPFCSKRCADVDLGNWLKGGYAIPAVETEEDAESGPGQPEEGSQNH